MRMAWIVVFLLLASCAPETADEVPAFAHQVEGPAYPWTHENLDNVHLRMDGILDKAGHVPLGGDEVCFEKAVCGEQH